MTEATRRLSGRVTVLLLMLLVPLGLAVASQALASRPGPPSVPEGPVVVVGSTGAPSPDPTPAAVTRSSPSASPPAAPGTQVAPPAVAPPAPQRPRAAVRPVAPAAPRVVQPRPPVVSGGDDDDAGEVDDD